MGGRGSEMLCALCYAIEPCNTSAALSMRVGCVQFDPHYPRTINALIVRADHTMYCQKRSKQTV